MSGSVSQLVSGSEGHRAYQLLAYYQRISEYYKMVSNCLITKLAQIPYHTYRVSKHGALVMECRIVRLQLINLCIKVASIDLQLPHASSHLAHLLLCKCIIV